MKASGFTLIELLISVTLLLLLSGLLVAGYTGFNTTQSVKQAVATVESNLQQARTKAASGTKPEGCDTLIGYSVNFTSTTQYTVTPTCANDTSPSQYAAVTYDLPRGVVFSPIPLSMIFYSLDRGVSRAQTIVVKDSGVIAKISILTSGVVTDFVPTPTP